MTATQLLARIATDIAEERRALSAWLESLRTIAEHTGNARVSEVIDAACDLEIELRGDCEKTVELAHAFGWEAQNDGTWIHR